MSTIQPNTLTVATYAAFAPVCSSDEQGVYGRDIDFLRAFAQQQGLAIAFQIFLFDRIWERLGRDEVDIAASGITPLPERQTPGVLWSDFGAAAPKGVPNLALRPYRHELRNRVQWAPVGQSLVSGFAPKLS